MDIIERLNKEREALVATIHRLQEEKQKLPYSSAERENLTSSIASLRLQVAAIQTKIADLVLSNTANFRNSTG
jgi:hypothetical protein